MKLATLSLVSGLAIILTGCTSKELTRSKAKQLIEASDLYKPIKRRVNLSNNEISEIIKSGYATFGGIGIRRAAVTDTGRQYFDNVSGMMGGFGGPALTPFSVLLAKAMKPIVTEVTGITGDEVSTKTVDYKWQWDARDQPEEVKRLIPSLAAVHDDSVKLKLYDDGWRPQFPPE